MTRTNPRGLHNLPEHLLAWIPADVLAEAVRCFEETRPLYDHPDGFTLGHWNGTLVIVDDMGLEINMPIGKQGLADLGAALIALAAELGESAA